MADGEYRRLTCGACTMEFTQTGPGRNAKTCSGCRRPHRAGYSKPRAPKPAKPPARTECQRCGASIAQPRRGKIYCSKACAYRERDGTALTREEYREKRRAESPWNFPCEHCGGVFIRRPSGTNRASGYQTRWCSMACRVAQAAEDRPGEVCPVFFNRCRGCLKEWTGQARRHFCGEACAKAQAKRKARDASEAKHRAQGRVVQCEDCGLAHCPVYGAQGPQVLCAPCAEIRRKRWRAMDGGSHVQRAKRAGVPYQYFNVRRVLERDGWTCQLCGVPTPKDARGSTKPDAPEFDHCIPLALGGPHYPENGQCLCRACNLRKADSWCDRSVAAAVTRGLRLPTGLDRRPQEAASPGVPQSIDTPLIVAPAPA